MDGKRNCAKDADKGWWFVTRRVKIFTLLDQKFGRKNASRKNLTDLGPFRGQEWSLSLIEWELNPSTSALPLRPKRFGVQRGELRLEVGDQGLRNTIPSTMIRN